MDLSKLWPFKKRLWHCTETRCEQIFGDPYEMEFHCVKEHWNVQIATALLAAKSIVTAYEFADDLLWRLSIRALMRGMILSDRLNTYIKQEGLIIYSVIKQEMERQKQVGETYGRLGSR